MTTRIVGIAGGSASGKSTLTRHLREALEAGVAVITLDEFFLTDQTQGPFITSPVDGQKHFDLNHPDAFDVPRILARIRELSHNSKAVNFILIDGAFSLALDALSRHMHLKVFVWLDDDIRIGRKIARNYVERGKDPAVTLQNYLNSGRPGHDLHVAQTVKKADLILHGERDPVENARIVATLIHNL